MSSQIRFGRNLIILEPTGPRDSWVVALMGARMGEGPTRDDAVAAAVAVLEWAVEALQGQDETAEPSE